MLSSVFVTQSYGGQVSNWKKVTYMSVWQQHGRLWISLPQARPVELTHSWLGKHSLLEDSKTEGQRGVMHSFFFLAVLEMQSMSCACLANAPPLSYTPRWKAAHLERATWTMWSLALEETVFLVTLFITGSWKGQGCSKIIAEQALEL